MEIYFALLALCEGNPPATGGFPAQRRIIPLTKASDVELGCFLRSAIEQMVDRTIETAVIWDAIELIMTSL